MQYHQDGFRPGNPSLAEQVVPPRSRSNVDVLVVGSGPAGLTLAAQLTAFPGLSVRIVEQRPGPLQVGQADGIACRSMEMFQAFGFAEKVSKEAYWVNETVFWRPDAATGRLARADRIQDVEDDLSEMPHVILSQARVHDFYLEVMAQSTHRLVPDYGCQLIDVKRTGDVEYPVMATLRRSDSTADTPTDDTPEVVHARYIVGCDGARSTVRRALGYRLEGEAARQLWGVMDVLAVTDFPDVRLKAAIQSADHGSLLIIPREGGFMVRMYIELDELDDGERAGDRGVTPETLIAKATAILSPYTLDVKEVAWWSAYEIGQRLSDRFDDVSSDISSDISGDDGDGERSGRTPRIFIAGDACHTHSPKAGQGMNVGMADAFNLGWKLASVIEGRSRPALLHTYTEERHAKAKELIDFDKVISSLFSAKPTSSQEAEQFQQYFQKQARYTAGVETRYEPSMITGGVATQHLSSGLVVGMRFHSAPVIRLADAKPMQLGHVLEADGRWRIIVFAPAGDRGQAGGAVAQLCSFLADDPAGPIRRYTPDGVDVDDVIDVRAVFQGSHRDMDLGLLPPLLTPTKGRLGVIDYQKSFCPDVRNGPDIFDQRGIDRDAGAVIVVRPDQYIADVLSITDRAALAERFDQLMIEPVTRSG